MNSRLNPFQLGAKKLSNDLVNVATGEHGAELVLADGQTLGFRAGNSAADNIVLYLMKILQLRGRDDVSPQIVVLGIGQDEKPGNTARTYLGQANAKPAKYFSLIGRRLRPASIFFHEYGAICELQPIFDSTALFASLSQISSLFARQIQANGGLMLHGALAEYDGSGIILAGPGNAGKSTASLRLPSRWRSLCDDFTLVVRDHKGKYWAHPWPTWSRFFDGGPGGTWNVKHAVPLEAVFFLKQAEVDQVSPIGSGHATVSLVESNRQATVLISHTTKEDWRIHGKQCFDNICTLAQSVPVHKLELSRTGAFWELLENTIAAHKQSKP